MLSAIYSNLVSSIQSSIDIMTRVCYTYEHMQRIIKKFREILEHDASLLHRKQLCEHFVPHQFVKDDGKYSEPVRKIAALTCKRCRQPRQFELHRPN